MERNKHPNCPQCRQKEAVYKKVYFINGKSVKFPNIFYLCSNPACYRKIDIEENKIITLIDGTRFYWIREDISLWGMFFKKDED